MVALRWCECDEARDEEQLAGRFKASGNGLHGPAERRPQLVPQRPVSGGKPGPVAGRRPRTFFWRRALVVSVIAGLGAMAWDATSKLAAVAGAQAPQGQRCSSGGAPGASQTAGSCGQVYVARPGDTIWSIAVGYARGGDPRPLVAQLEAEIGGGTLQPGERLVVP